MNASSPIQQRITNFRQRAAEFFTKPASARPLAALRIGLAGVLLLQGLGIAASLQEVFGPNGAVRWSVFAPAEASEELFSGVPSVQWVIDALAIFKIRVSGESGTTAVFLVYMAALCGLLAGWRTRFCAFLAWGTHLLLFMSAEFRVYGADSFAQIFLFYCIWMPTGDVWSVDRRAGYANGEPSLFARASLRLFQFHMCMVYLTGGIHKALGPDWWDGEAIWRALNLREMATFDFTWMAYVPGLAVLLGLATLAVELGYAFLVWPQRTRKWMAFATIGLHIGIAATMGLVSFGAVMIVLTTSAFLVSPEPLPQTAEQPAAEHRFDNLPVRSAELA